MDINTPAIKLIKLQRMRIKNTAETIRALRAKGHIEPAARLQRQQQYRLAMIEGITSLARELNACTQ